MEPENTVVDYELAKFLLERNLFLLLNTALNLSIQNQKLLVPKYHARHITGTEQIADEVADRFPYENERLKENLALLYYKRSNYESALAVLKELKDTSFADKLTSKIKDSLDQETQSAEVNPIPEKTAG